MFDVVVIGGGLFGAAAARHLAELGRRVVVVISPEPPDSAYASATGPLASHYDQGRIVRSGGVDPVFGEAGRRSFARFSDIEARSGIKFFQPRPLVSFRADPQVDFDASRSAGADVALLSIAEVLARTGIRLPDGFAGGAVLETETAGIINPRRLVQAQLTLAAGADAVVVPEPAVSCAVEARGVTVATASGRVIPAEQVVIATGAYGAGLLGPGVDAALAIQRRLRTIALIELDGDDPGSARDLPSLSGMDFSHPLDEPKLEEMYWVPPVRYPDGGLYLKIGGNSLPMIAADQDSVANDIAAWFASGASATEADALFALTRDLLPGFNLRLAGHKPCVVSYTADEQPILRRHSERVVLALAGNGSGAKASDDFGRQAAELAFRATDQN